MTPYDLITLIMLGIITIEALLVIFDHLKIYLKAQTV